MGLSSELEEKPIIRRKRRSKVESEITKSGIVLMAGISLQTIFQAISYKAGAHWALSDEETMRLATDLDAALTTLPGEYYAQFITYISKCAPWLALAFTFNAIVTPRIQQTQRQAKLDRQAKTSVTQVANTPTTKQESLEGDWRTNPNVVSIGYGN